MSMLNSNLSRKKITLNINLEKLIYYYLLRINKINLEIFILALI